MLKAGNVGINTTAPVETLDITGTIRATQGAKTGTVTSAFLDYAEWVEIDNDYAKDDFDKGEIICIKNSRITKIKGGCNNFMVISTKPSLVGGEPINGKYENNESYEKVAFTGQVPVKVKGKVNDGDYILPYESLIGVGYAVSKDEITFEQYKKAVGIAWESSDNEDVKKINVAVGIK